MLQYHHGPGYCSIVNPNYMSAARKTSTVKEWLKIVPSVPLSDLKNAFIPVLVHGMFVFMLVSDVRSNKYIVFKNCLPSRRMKLDPTHCPFLFLITLPPPGHCHPHRHHSPTLNPVTQTVRRMKRRKMMMTTMTTMKKRKLRS